MARVFRSAVHMAWAKHYTNERMIASSVRSSEWANIQYQIGRLIKQLEGLVPSYCDSEGNAINVSFKNVGGS